VAAWRDLTTYTSRPLIVRRATTQRLRIAGGGADGPFFFASTARPAASVANRRLYATRTNAATPFICQLVKAAPQDEKRPAR
jgi:hypothetical protein